MKKRALGNTGIEVSEIGLGTWGLGGVYYGKVDAKDGVATVRAYLDAGGNHIDGAFSYHASEEVVGQGIQGYDRDQIVITSKSYAGCFDRTEIPKVRTELEITLKDLGTDYVDVYMIHGSPTDPDHMHELCDLYEQLKDEGKIRAIGASMPGPNVTEETVRLARQYVDSGRIEVIQLVYSLLRQRHAEVFDAAKAAGVGMIARWVLESGLLTGAFEPGQRFQWPDHRARYGDELDTILEETIRLKDRLPEGYENQAQLVIAFALAHPGLSGVVLGALEPAHVERNLVTDRLPPLSDELVAALRAEFGPRNDAFNPTLEIEHVPSVRHGVQG